MKIQQQLIEILLREEIQRVVADAMQRRGVLDIGEHANRIATRFPTSGISAADLFDDIISEASNAGAKCNLQQAVAAGP